MKVHGITFNNRTKAKEEGEDAKPFHDAEFVAFASLCAAAGVEKYIKHVEYESNSCCYWIVVDDEHKFTDIHGAIDWAADATLGQFVLFDMVNHKGGLDEPI